MVIIMPHTFMINDEPVPVMCLTCGFWDLKSKDFEQKGECTALIFRNPDKIRARYLELFTHPDYSCNGWKPKKAFIERG